MVEIWKQVSGYEEIYEVSDLGRIRTAKNKTTNSSRCGERKWKQRILKQKTDKQGYKRISLWKDKKEKTYLVHRLVAKAFIPMVKNKNCVNHLDGNPSNNYLKNLEWCDHKENLSHAYKHRLNQAPDPTVLVNTITSEAFYFMSKAKASEFLGRNKEYLSAVIQKGGTKVDEYEIYIKPILKKKRG